jgi:hypothetical protein
MAKKTKPKPPINPDGLEKDLDETLKRLRRRGTPPTRKGNK